MTACGKTHYLLEMLEKDYNKHFEYIFLICPTYQWNKTYQNWKYNDDSRFFPIPCDQDEVNGFLRYITNIYCGTNSLVILDDCASSQSIKNRTSEIVKLGFSARQTYRFFNDSDYATTHLHRKTLQRKHIQVGYVLQSK